MMSRNRLDRDAVVVREIGMEWSESKEALPNWGLMIGWLSFISFVG